MATSSSDDSCSAPTDFDISSNSELSNGRVTVTGPRCPICKKSKRIYYCRDCIRRGDFYHTSLANSESFAEKRSRFVNATRDKLLLLERVQGAFEPKAREAALRLEIATCQEKIRLLKLVIKETQEATAYAFAEIESNALEIEKRRGDLTYNADCNRKIALHGTQRLQASGERRQRLLSARDELKVVVRGNIQDLVRFIFPITKVCAEESTEDGPREETVIALAEATRTAYVRGRWIYTDNYCGTQFVVVESPLPGNGDYSAYNAWVKSNKESVPPSASSELGHRNTGCAISAALTYLCQMVSIVAFYLDIWLPKRLCYSDFCSHELSEQEFAYKVAELNANVLHLCLSQNIDPDQLQPRHTASNLVLLLDPKICDLGRCGAYEVNSDVMRSMEESLFQDLDSSRGSDDDAQEDVATLGEWVTITEHVSVPPRVVMSAVTNIPTSRALPSAAATDGTATSVAGGLVMSAAASVFSLWKAATGQK